MTSQFLQGFMLQASLILALGAQNIFVLNSGLRRERPLLVAGLCAFCDAILIFVGVLGVATVFVQIPLLKIIFGLLGVGFLGFYGVMKLKDAFVGTTITTSSAPPASLKKTVLATLGFSLLNPHVYLDTIVLIGGYSVKFFSMAERLIFGLGAAVFSVIWFFGLALSAAAGNKLLHSAHAMRIIAFVSGIILLWLMIKLGLEVAEWIANVPSTV